MSFALNPHRAVSEKGLVSREDSGTAYKRTIIVLSSGATRELLLLWYSNKHNKYIGYYNSTSDAERPLSKSNKYIRYYNSTSNAERPLSKHNK